LTIGDALKNKFNAWDYENEWRIPKAKFGVVKIDPKCITKIYVGILNKFPPIDKDIYGDKDSYFSVLEVAAGCNLPNAKYQRLMPSMNSYEIKEI